MEYTCVFNLETKSMLWSNDWNYATHTNNSQCDVNDVWTCCGMAVRILLWFVVVGGSRVTSQVAATWMKTERRPRLSKISSPCCISDEHKGRRKEEILKPDLRNIIDFFCQNCRVCDNNNNNVWSVCYLQILQQHQYEFQRLWNGERRFEELWDWV